MQTITDGQTFEAEVTGAAGTVLVDFFTPDCNPCRGMAPVLEEIASERTDLKIVKLDAAANYEIAGQFRVSAFPTFILFHDGEVKAQLIGARSKKALTAWIDSSR